MSKAEEHREAAIVGLMNERDADGFIRQTFTREQAKLICDHIAAHAVETVRDLLAAEEKLAREREAKGCTG